MAWVVARELVLVSLFFLLVPTISAINASIPELNSTLAPKQCDFGVAILLNTTLFDHPDNFTFKVRATNQADLATNLTMRAYIHDLHDNLIKEYKPATNARVVNRKTSAGYKPKLEAARTYVLSTNISTSCNDSVSKNNFAEKIVSIKGEPLPSQSTLQIERFYDLGTDNLAKFGQTIRIRINAYKGDTRKEVITTWIEDKNGKKISKQSKSNLENKFTPYTLTLPLQLVPNCNEKLKDGTYTVVVAGLDALAEKRIAVEDITSSLCETKIVEKTKQVKKSKPSGLLFEIQEYETYLELNKKTKTKVLLNNQGDESLQIKVWSYIYRGSKSYSGDRAANLQEFTLPGNTVRTVTLENLVQEADAGSYKLKVLLNKNNQKTNKDITKNVVITAPKLKEETQQVLAHAATPKIPQEELKTQVKYGLIYESTTEKTKHTVPLFLIAASILLNMALILKKT